MIRPILPGQVIGILGGGQLGRMLAMVARRSGYRVHVFTSETGCPAGHFANRVFLAEYHDESTFREFANSIDVLSFEFESVPSQPLEWVPERVPIRPGPHVFHTTQNRLREKLFLREHAIPLSPFASVETESDLKKAILQVGLPAVLKSAGGGYDGKGQAVIRMAGEAEQAWQAVGSQPATLEKFVDLDCEVSVIVARGITGELATYGPIRNRHAQHILDISSAPAGLPPVIEKRAIELALAVAQGFDLVGLICIEFFVSKAAEVLVNEIAPRTHNSGHLTIEAHATSQFEQQLRAICGLPLGSTRQIRPAVMVNLLGDLWNRGEPDWAWVAKTPEAYLHLYDKVDPKPGRKMGHLTVCGDLETSARNAVALRQRLRRDPG